MDYEAYEKLILTSLKMRLIVKALGPLSEADRKKISVKARKLLKQLETNELEKDASKALSKIINKRDKTKWNHYQARETVNARLGVFAVAPVSYLKANRLYLGNDVNSLKDQIIRDRNPDWLADWVDDDMNQESPSLDFPLIWGWVKSGMIAQPQADGFYTRFANYMMATGFYDQGPKLPISKALKKDPDLLPLVDSLFRVESFAFNNNSWFKKGAADDYEDWTTALIKLCDDGTLSRDHLLKLSVDGLALDLKQNQLSGFHKFHKTLKPTPEEQSKLHDEYLELLAHPVGHVAKFGITMLAALQKKKRLDSTAFARECVAAFYNDAKGNAVATVKLLAAILKSSPKDKAPFLAALVEALRHPQADVQGLALDQLETYQSDLTPDIQNSLQYCVEYVAATHKQQLHNLIGAESTDTNDGADEDISSANDLVKDLSATEIKRLGLATIIGSSEFTYSPIEDDILSHRVLSEADRIDPITDEDTLIQAIAHAVELVDGPDEMERIFDGISRLCGERFADFEQKTAPVLHRIEKGGSGSTKGLLHWGYTNELVLALILTWLGKKVGPIDPEKFDLVVALAPTDHFLLALRERVSRGHPCGLISAPTHKGGWIDPKVWVQRLIKTEDDNQDIDRHDLIRSILRLAPDNRAAALKKADKLSGDIQKLARFALGGDETPDTKNIQDHPLWISAARARDPYKDWREEFSTYKFSDPWPDSLEPARYDWRPFIKLSEYDGTTYRYPRLEATVNDVKLHIEAPDTKGAKVKALLKKVKGGTVSDYTQMPAAALSVRKKRRYEWSGEITTDWHCYWLSFQWPLNPQGAHMIGILNLMARIDEDSSNWDPNYGFMHSLFQIGRPWRDNAHILLLMGLAGRDADTKGLAIDALISAIELGMFNPDIFGKVLKTFAVDGWVKLNRLGDALEQVSQVSELHAALIGKALQVWLPDADLKQRGIFRPLEILLENQTRIGLPLSPSSISALQTIKGSSKAAKCAKALIKLEAGDPTIHDRLKSQAISGRL